MINFPLDCQIIHNKYYKWYESIMLSRINNPPSNCYTEKHHIIPKSIDKTSKNIVVLTAREHFVAHMLLPRFIINPIYQKKMIFALWGICNQNSKTQNRSAVNSHTYERLKKCFSDSISGNNHWMKDPIRRSKMSKLMTGRKYTEDRKRKMSKLMMGRKLLWGDKIGKANKGKKRTEAMNLAQSIRMKEAYRNGLLQNHTKGQTREKFICKHCGVHVDIANMNKWHNENSNCVARLNAKKSLPGKRGKNKQSYPQKISICKYCNGSFGTQGFNRWHGEKCRNKPNS